MLKEFFKKYKAYIISALISLAVGGLSALLTRENMKLFELIQKPPLSPPAFLFPIVWTLLYALMGISAAMIYEKRTLFPKETENALTTYASSLVVNFSWSIIFFNFKAFFLALIWIILLEYLIIRYILQYRKINKAAALIQIPYAVWVAFASYLTLGIWILNG